MLIIGNNARFLIGFRSSLQMIATGHLFIIYTTFYENEAEELSFFSFFTQRLNCLYKFT
jgi:hypothetical protein